MKTIWEQELDAPIPALQTHEVMNMEGSIEGRGGIVTAGMKRAPMDMNVEHIFVLDDVKFKDNVPTQFGPKNKIMMVFKEAGKDGIDAQRVWVNLNESYNIEKSQLIAFLKKVSSKPINAGDTVLLSDHLKVGMKISARVIARLDRDTGAPTGYYDFVPASVKPVK
jgi:hypothetical protein